MSLEGMKQVFNYSNTTLIKQIGNVQSINDLDNILVKGNIDIDTVKYLINKYFNIVNESNRYDNKSKILDIIIPISISNFISVDNLYCLDIIDYFRYKQYYINDLKIQDDNIIDVLKFNRSATETVTINGIKYIWKKRKNYFNVLRHGLDFSKAVDLMKDGEYVKDKEQDTYKVFILLITNIFLIVEFNISNNEKRIVSFRKSTIKEYDKAKEESAKMVLDREKIMKAEQLTDEEYDCLMRHYRPEDKDFTGPERKYRTFEDMTEEEREIDDHLDEGI